MKFQALILSIVLIISFSLNSSKKNNSIEIKQDTIKENDKLFFLFLNDFSSAILGKLALAKQNITAKFSNTEQNVNQNLANFKQILTEKQKGLFSESHPKLNSEKNLYTEKTENSTLVSEIKINPPLPICNFNKENFNAERILIKYLNYNVNLFELNQEKRWPIASLVKLMTSVITAEKIGFDKEIIINKEAVYTEGIDGNFETGEIYKSGDLIKAMLISSSNDAAMAIIENFGKKEFIDEMQKKAIKLGMFQTSYFEPTGLSYINQSTINDLVKLVNYIHQNHPKLLEISRQKKTIITDLKTKKQKILLSTNRFAGQSNFIGGKTGFIEKSGRNLIAIFNINGKTILSIILGAEDSFKETEKIKELLQTCI